ncbi:MAG: nucleotidyltransferase family protein [Vallitaleaceae bacterium]|nr:nucleotidyltransferase family protein [Vallitaleaceae bacterium]
MDAILLAAGYSSRTQTNKMALEIGSKSVISHLIETFYPTCENIIVVGGHYYDATAALVKQYSKVKLVRNDQYELGMFTSIKVGVKEVQGDFFITPGDYPLVTKKTIEQMRAHFEQSKQAGTEILIPTYLAQRGHPILLSSRLKEPLILESQDSSLRIFKDRYQVEELEVEDSGILLDIDSMEDYKDLVKLYEERCQSEN